MSSCFFRSLNACACGGGGMDFTDANWEQFQTEVSAPGRDCWRERVVWSRHWVSTIATITMYKGKNESNTKYMRYPFITHVLFIFISVILVIHSRIFTCWATHFTIYCCVLRSAFRCFLLLLASHLVFVAGWCVSRRGSSCNGG